MRKKLILSIMAILIAIILALSGCAVENGPQVAADDEGAQEEPQDVTALDGLWEDAPEEALAILINYPSDQQLQDYPVSERLVLEVTEERLLLIPSDNVNHLIIWEIAFQNDEFVRTEPVYENLDLQEDYIMDLVVMRPEGGPHYQLTLKGADFEADYYFTYDGKDGTPNIEYIFDK